MEPKIGIRRRVSRMVPPAAPATVAVGDQPCPPQRKNQSHRSSAASGQQDLGLVADPAVSRHHFQC